MSFRVDQDEAAREILAQEIRVDLHEQPESFDPEWLMAHLDLDRVREDLLPDMIVAMSKHPLATRNDPTTALGEARMKATLVRLANKELDAKLQDPEWISLALGEDLYRYLNVESATEDAIDTGQWEDVPGIRSRLASVLDKLRHSVDDG